LKSKPREKSVENKQKAALPFEPLAHSELYGVTYYKTALFIATAVRPPNPTIQRTGIRLISPLETFSTFVAENVKGIVPKLNELSTLPWRRVGEWMYRSTYS
jgi:hypothetical protein